MNNLEQLGNLSEFVCEIRHRLKLFNPELFVGLVIDIPKSQSDPARLDMIFSNRQGGRKGEIYLYIGMGLDIFMADLEQKFIDAGLTGKSR